MFVAITGVDTEELMSVGGWANVGGHGGDDYVMVYFLLKKLF